MPDEIIPASLRRRFQESYSIYAVLRNITYDFEDAGLTKSALPAGAAPSGERRRLVEQYYSSVDWTNDDEVAQVLSAWEAHLQRLEDSHQTEELQALRRVLRRHGYGYTDGRISPTRDLPSPSTAEAVEDQPDDLWKIDHFRLFLTHVAGFKSKIALLRKELWRYQIDGFVAHEDIEPSREWQAEIERALGAMDALVAVLSEGFDESSWTDQEVGWALGRGVPVFAVIRDLDPYGFIGKRQGLIGRGKKVPDVAEAIFRVLLAQNLTRDRLRSHLVARLASSLSWD